MEYVTIEIPVHLWWQVDGCVDNSMAIDAVEAVIATTMAGSCVRDAGWRASAAFDGERDQYGWPPRNHPLPIVLRARIGSGPSHSSTAGSRMRRTRAQPRCARSSFGLCAIGEQGLGAD